MHKVGLWVTALAIVVLLVLPMGASAETAQTAGGSGCAKFYSIKYGDTLFKIAQSFGTSVDYLASLNGISNPDYIVAGTTICVKEAPAGSCYTVKKGNTLGNIAWKYGWTAKYLAQVNGIKNPDRIYPGQLLWIPAH